MVRFVPLVLVLAGCVSAGSTKVHESGSASVADEAEALRAEMKTLRAENERLRREIDELEFWIAQYREMPADRPDAVPVLKVTREFVLLPREVHDTVGIDNWVYLRRGSQYVGRARVLQVTLNGTTARFDAEFPGPAAPPRVGDVVVTLPVR